MSKLPSEEIQKLLKEVVDHFDKEDTSVRERQIRTARRLKLFWEGFQRAWYSEVAHDWRIWDEAAEGDDTNQSYYDKPINVFRAYLESIIAALSVTVPPITCYPDDATNTLDLETAKAGDKIAQLIQRHNNVSLLWLHALFIFCTEGMVACYNYPKSDNKYGTYEKKKYSNEEEMHQYTTCPNCGFEMGDEVATEGLKNKFKDEFQPDDEDVPIQDMVQNDDELCPACMQMISPEISQRPLIVTRLVGITTEAKTRVCLEAYGLLYVKVANYARKQEETPYLMYSYETHTSFAVERFEHLHGHDALTPDKIKASSGPRNPYEEWGRLSPQYQGEYPLNVVTIRNVWLRPSAFNVLDEDEAAKLKKKYPNGAKVVLVNDCFGEACNESLDDCWTLTYNPLADYIHHDPLGLLLTSIQEITNDLISLTLQTIEHGIPQTFADPGVLDFDAYRQLEAIPGGMYESKPLSGKKISEGFYEVKTATLSAEVLPFAQQVQNLGQLVSGALPSLFGGAMQGTGETASQYSMSRAQATQRLQNTWKIFTCWWKEVFGKAIPIFINEVEDDERDVQRTKDGNFVNILIKKSELEGKIGKVELEANENLPQSWAQIKDTIMLLLQAANPAILNIIGAPENLPIIREAIGLTDFFVPGEDDRDEQYDEIKILLNTIPIETGMPDMPEIPSVEIDPIYNNHKIHFEIVRKWATSEEGRQTKEDNPEGYKNVLLHGKLHFMQMQGIGPESPAPEGDGAAPTEKPNPLDKEAPITGDNDVQATA